jgi:hypothetical protein
MAEATITFALTSTQREDIQSSARTYGVGVSEYIRFCCYQQQKRQLKSKDVAQFMLAGQLELPMRG